MKMVETDPYDRKTLQGLRQAGFTRNKVYDKGQYEPLKKTLLRLGGQAVAMKWREPDFENLMARGVPYRADGFIHRRGRLRQCHQNAARLWRRSKGKIGICTGYALSQSGMWRQHSWGVSIKDHTVYETTEPRVLYFGFLLTEAESELFYKNNVRVPVS